MQNKGKRFSWVCVVEFEALSLIIPLLNDVESLIYALHMLAYKRPHPWVQRFSLGNF